MPSPGSGGHQRDERAPLALSAREVLREARALERDARIPEAMSRFSSALAIAARTDDSAAAAEAARRLAVLQQGHGDHEEARRLCHWSHSVARSAGLESLAAEALNTLGVVQMLGGEPAEARQTFERAIRGANRNAEVRARAEQNLGILANIRGDLDAALAHYGRSLEAYRELHDEHGCALAIHNLGMVSADRGDHHAAAESFLASLATATRIDNKPLRAICLVSLAELDAARQRFESAMQGAEEAFAIFNRLGSLRGKADARRVMGIVYRESGRPALAETHLQDAIRLALLADATLIEAEASRDIALLHQSTGRNPEALRALDRAHKLFRRLEARADAVNVGGRIAELQNTYLSVVRGWGSSIESTDDHTYGHCERVAQHAVLMARHLGLDEHDETAVLIGAYLHDVGMVRVPQEILRANRPLTPEESALLELHPVWGLELLASIDFPWKIAPIVHRHHERIDGNGYPDGLREAEIPLAAQIVGLLDEYDHLLCGRFGEPVLTPAEAAVRILDERGRWSTPVLDAFRATIAR